MTNLIKKCSTLAEYLIEEAKLSTTEKEIEFEDFVGAWLRVHPGFGPNVYSPNNNEVPRDIQKTFKMDSLMKGKRSMGADWFSGDIDEIKAIEVKYQHAGSAIKLDKIAPKEVALNKTKITKRYLATNMSRVSNVVTELLGNWVPIFGDDIYTEDFYQLIRNYSARNVFVNNYLGSLAGYRKASKGPEKGSDTFHKQSIKDLFNEITEQLKYDGHARCLAQKPTAAGKSLDPVLLWYDYLLPNLFSTKDRILTVGIAPRLTILSGNVIKRVDDIVARNPANTKIIVIASEIDSGSSTEDRDELNRIKQYVTVISPGKENKNIIKILADWKRDGYHLHVETTIHSYHNFGDALVKLGITEDFMAIDEVKNTVLDLESTRTNCLFDATGEATIRVGFDANIRGTNTDDSVEYATSMLNTELWRNFTQPTRTTIVEWDELDCTSRGFKRPAKAHITQIDINDLPSVLSEARINKKRDLVKFNKVTVPLMWVLKLQQWALLLLDDPKNYILFSLSNRKRVGGFVKFANMYWPKFVTELGDTRRTEIKRLLAMKFVDIYGNGVQHNTVMNTVNSIQSDNPNGAFVCQCRKLSEGWDPTDGWVDAAAFIDPSHSSTHISQTFGRTQRIGGNTESALIAEIMFIDSTLVHTLKNEFNRVARVCKLLAQGSNINDSITITKYGNQPGGGGGRGGNILIAVHELEEATDLLEIFKRQLEYGNTNVFSPIVNEIFESAYKQQYFDVPTGSGKQKKIISNKVINDSRFIEFFSQYGINRKDEYGARRSKFTDIIFGKHFLLSEENKKLGSQLYKKYVLNERLKHKRNMLAQLNSAKTVVATTPMSYFVGNDTYGILQVLRKGIKENYSEKMHSEKMTGSENRSLLRNFPWSANILLQSYINLCDNLVKEVEKRNNAIIKRIEDLQEKTTAQSFSGTMKGEISNMVLLEFGIVKKENKHAVLLGKSKYSLVECEQFAKKNQKLITDFIEKNYKNYINRKDQWEATMGFANDNNLIHSLSNEKINNLCPNKEEIETHYRLHAARFVADNRKDYVNPSAKTFIAEGVEYESANQANRAVGVRVRMLAKYRSDVYYFKEDGPSTPTKIRFHNTPYGNGPKTGVYDLCKTAGEEYTSQYKKGSTTQWWNKVSTLYPEEFFVEDRIATKEEIAKNHMSLSGMSVAHNR